MALMLDSVADVAAAEVTLEPVVDPGTGKPAIVSFKRGDAAVRLAVVKPAAGGPMRLAVERASKRDGATVKRWRATALLADIRDSIKHGLIAA